MNASKVNTPNGLRGSAAASALRRFVVKHHIAGSQAERIERAARFFESKPDDHTFPLEAARRAIAPGTRSAQEFREFTSSLKISAESFGDPLRVEVDTAKRTDAADRIVWVVGADPTLRDMAEFSRLATPDRQRMPTVAQRGFELDDQGRVVVRVCLDIDPHAAPGLDAEKAKRWWSERLPSTSAFSIEVTTAGGTIGADYEKERSSDLRLAAVVVSFITNRYCLERGNALDEHVGPSRLWVDLEEIAEGHGEHRFRSHNPIHPGPIGFAPEDWPLELVKGVEAAARRWVASLDPFERDRLVLPHAVHTNNVEVELRGVEHGRLGSGRPVEPVSTTDGDRAGDPIAELFRQWLDDDTAAPFFVLLGDYGMGKTTACQILNRDMYNDWLEGRSEVVPIYLDLRYAEVPADGSRPRLDSVIEEVLTSTTRARSISLRAADVIEAARAGRALVIFDGLDEVLLQLDSAQADKFVSELISIVPSPDAEPENGPWAGSGNDTDSKAGVERAKPRRRVVMSCRTHYFATSTALKSYFTGRSRGDVSAEAFRTVELLPWDRHQISDFLRQWHALRDAQTAPEAVERSEAILANVHDLAELARRPVHLRQVVEQVDDLDVDMVIRAGDIYRHTVELTWERDGWKHQIAPDMKERVLEHLAAHLHRSGQRRIDVDKLAQWLRALRHHDQAFDDWREDNPKHGELLVADLRTATLIIRGDDRNFGFAHTSMQEYFLARYLVRGLVEGAPTRWDLAMPSDETMGFVTDLMARIDEAEEPTDRDAAMRTLKAIRDRYQEQISELAFRYALRALAAGTPAPPLTRWDLRGAQMNNLRLAGKQGAPRLAARDIDLTGACLRNAVFEHVDLSGSIFDACDLTSAKFLDCKIANANVDRAALVGTWFRTSDLNGTALERASNHRTHIAGCDPDGVNLNYDPQSQNYGPFLRYGHTDWVLGVAFNHDGTRIGTVSGDGTGRVWDAATGEQLTQLDGHTGGVLGVAFNHDGTRIATVGGDGTGRVWDAATGEQLTQLDGHTGGVLGVAFNHDGTRIATVGGDGTGRVWDAATGEQLTQLDGHTDWVWGVAFNHDGTRIATVSDDGTGRVWDAATGEQLTQLDGHTDWVWGVAFNHDGTRIATVSHDGTGRVWDAATGEQLTQLDGHTGGVRGVAFNHDGTRIATVSHDGTGRVWDAATGEQLTQLDGHTDWVWGVAFNHDGTRIATVSDDGTGRVWDAATGEQLTQLDGHTGGVRGVAFNHDGTRIATVSGDGTGRVWDAATGEQLTQLDGHTGGVWGVAFNHDGTRIATVSDDGTGRVWDAATGEQLTQLDGHTGGVLGVAFNHDGTRIATVSDDGTGRVWDAATGEQLTQLDGHTGGVWGVAFNHDGTRIATVSHDGTGRVWDAATGEQLTQLDGHTGRVRGVAFNHDGTRIATVSDDGTGRVWDAATGEQLTQLDGHTDWVRGVAFNHDGTRIATVGGDGTGRVWDAATGEQLTQLDGHTGGVWGVAFNHDGTRIATVSGDGTGRVWDAATGEQLLMCAQWSTSDKKRTAERTTGWAAIRAGNVTACSADAWAHLLCRIRDPATGRVEFWPIEYAGPLPAPTG